MKINSRFFEIPMLKKQKAFIDNGSLIYVKFIRSVRDYRFNASIQTCNLGRELFLYTRVHTVMKIEGKYLNKHFSMAQLTEIRVYVCHQPSMNSGEFRRICQRYSRFPLSNAPASQPPFDHSQLYIPKYKGMFHLSPFFPVIFFFSYPLHPPLHFSRRIDIYLYYVIDIYRYFLVGSTPKI